MLDQELDPKGLNGHFWEEWISPYAEDSMYYFAEAGEFRLNKPPYVTG